MPFDPANQPLQSAGALSPVEVLHDAPVQVSPAYAVPSDELSALAGEPGSPPAPTLPPLPDFSTLPPLPGELPVEPVTPVAADPLPATQPADPLPVTPPAAVPVDPGQFRIPGQS